MSKARKTFAPWCCLVLAGLLTPGGLSSTEGPEVEFYSSNQDLDTYVHTALALNPGLAEALARYRSALQKVPQVTALPDPMLTYTQFIRNVETRVGPQLQSVALSQKFPWFGKLDLKGQALFKEAASLHQLYLSRQRDLIYDVKKTYYELSFLDRALEVAGEEKYLLEHYERLAQGRYRTGQGLQQAVIKIQAELTRILNRMAMLDQQRKSLVARLNTLMDKEPEAAVPPVRGLPLPKVSLDLEQLYAMGELHRQELKAVSARIERSEKSVELARKDFWPDVTLGAGFVNVGDRNDLAGRLMPPPDNGKNVFQFSIGVNLPIFRDKYRAEELEATETLIAERKGYLNIRNEMEFSIRDQVIRLQTLLEQMDLFEEALIPQAEEVLQSTESAYETGQVGALELLDSERMRLEVRLVNARYSADYLLALAGLERAIGTRFPR